MKALRTSGWLWGLRLIQILVNLAAVAVVGVNGSGWNNLACALPTELVYGIVVVNHTSNGQACYTLTETIGCHLPTRSLIPRICYRWFAPVGLDAAM